MTSVALLLRVGLVAIEVCWLCPLALLLGDFVEARADAPLVSAPVVVVLLALSQGATRWLRRRGWRLGVVRALLVALGAAAVLGVVSLERSLVDPRELVARPALWAALGFGLFLWWRGIARGRGGVDLDDVERAFGRGVLFLIVLLLLAASDPARAPALQARMAPWVVGFFLAALSTLALARLEAVRRETRAREGTAPAIGRHWLSTTAAVVAGLVAFSLVLSQLISFGLIGAVLGPPLQLLMFGVGLILFLLILPFALLLGLIFRLLQALLPEGLLRAQTRLEPRSLVDQFRDAVTHQQLPPELLELAKWLLIFVVVAVVLSLLARAVLFRKEDEQEEEEDEERESVWSWKMLGAALASWLRGLRARLLQQRAVVETPVAEAPPSAEEVQALTVREVYRQLLRLGATLGASRARSTTPSEHRPRLEDRLDPDEDIDALTEAYERARYGPEAPTEEDVVAARESLARVRGAEAEGSGALPPRPRSGS